MPWPPTPGPRSSHRRNALTLSHLCALMSWVIHSSICMSHLCTVISWVTCILSRHINRMTGHHRLQEQLTPPHKHLCVQTSHSFRTPSADSFSFCCPATLSPFKDTASCCCYIQPNSAPTMCPTLKGWRSILGGKPVFSVPQGVPVVAFVNTLFTSKLEKWLKTWIEVDVYFTEGEEKKNFAFSQQSTEIQSGVTWGHTECPVLFIKPPSSCHWKREAERCLATGMEDAS